MKAFTWKKIWSLPTLTIVFIVILDQWTKYIILNSSTLALEGKIEIIPNIFKIVCVMNTGAAWGILANSTTLLALISCCVFILGTIYYNNLTTNLTERCIAISIMMGGIAGNFIDRVLRKTVVDFLSFTYESFEWPAFNVADSAICIGVAIYSISSIARGEQVESVSPPVIQPQ